MSSSYQLQPHRSEGVDPQNGHVPKARRSVYDPVLVKKTALIQEFKDTHRERSLESRESSVPKTSEHKLRKAFDEILSENNVRKKRLHELNLRLTIMKRDDISGVDVDEKEIEENIEKDIEEYGLETVRKFRGSSTNGSFQGGKGLLEKHIIVKKMLEKTLIQKEVEEENTRILQNKVTKMKQDQKLLTERIGKRESLYKLMKKRFLDLGTTENTARNKLIRTTNKLLSIKQEMKKQQQKEDNYFAKKGVSFNRTQTNLEGLKDTTARNIIYMEETQLKKAQLDDKLEEALFDEKQITAKRQSSEYILLYIQLLEILEDEFIKREKASSLNLDVPGQKFARGRSLGSREYLKDAIDEQNSTLRSQSKDADRKMSSINAVNAGKDRDMIITRIAQFYDNHPQGSGVLVQNLLKIYTELQFKEQTLASRYHELNIERQNKKRLTDKMETELNSFQREFILMEERKERDEEMSPEHARQTEKNVVGKLGQYNQKAVGMAEYLVNICTIGLQNTLIKLKNASSSLNKKSGKLSSVELIAKVYEIETFLAAKKEDDWQDVTPGRKKGGIKKLGQTERENSHRDMSPLLRPQEIHVTRNKSITKDHNENPFNFEPNSMQSIQTPKEHKNMVPSHQRFDQDKEAASVRSEEEGSKSIFTQQGQAQAQGFSDEINKVEQLFKNILNASQEVLHVFKERFIEEKWLLDYLTKEDIKRVLIKYAKHYPGGVSEEVLKHIFKDLKDDARQAQKIKTSETFDLIEALLLLYLKLYKKKHQDVKNEHNTQIRSVILDNPNRVLAITEHVEDVFDARCKDIHHLGQLEFDEKKHGENGLHTEIDEDIDSLGEKTPKAEPVFSARDAIEALHAKYIEERRKTSSNSYQYLRSNSAPKIRVKHMKKRTSDGLSNFDEDDSHMRLSLRHDEKVLPTAPKVMSMSKSKTRHTSGAGISMLKADFDDGSLEFEKKTMRDFFDIRQKRPMTQRTEAPKRFVPSSYARNQKTSEAELEFVKKVLKDDQILKKISMLEKKNTEFDQKSKDCERRRNYVPDFSLLGKYGAIRRKDNQQTVSQWWNMSESKLMTIQNQERSQSQSQLSPERPERGSTSHRDYRKAPSLKTFFIPNLGKQRSHSKPTLKSWSKMEPMSQTMKMDFRIKVTKPHTSQEDSFEGYEERIYNQVVNFKTNGSTSKI